MKQKKKKKTHMANMLPQLQSVTMSVAPWRENRHTPPPPKRAQHSSMEEHKEADEEVAEEVESGP